MGASNPPYGFGPVFNLCAVVVVVSLDLFKLVAQLKIGRSPLLPHVCLYRGCVLCQLNVNFHTPSLNYRATKFDLTEIRKEPRIFDDRPRRRPEVGKMTCMLCDFRLTEAVLRQTSPSIRHTHVFLLGVVVLVYTDSRFMVGFKLLCAQCLYTFHKVPALYFKVCRIILHAIGQRGDPPSSGSQQRPSHVRGTHAPKAAKPIRGNSGSLLPRLVNFCPHHG